VLAVTTGMRRRELLGLHWVDVDLDGAYTFAPSKTLRSRRKVALTTVAIAVLRRHWQRQDEERTALGAEWHEEDLVFTNRVGGPLRANHILQRQFTPLLRKAGLSLIRFHDLRHTAATLLLRQGVHPKIVAEVLGHSTISMTLDIYSHVIPDMQKDATVALDRLLEDHGSRSQGREPIDSN